MFVSGVYVSGDVKGWSVGGEGNHEAVRLRCRTSGVLDHTKIVLYSQLRTRETTPCIPYTKIRKRLKIRYEIGGLRTS
jgi:hypothetical protein